MNIGNIALFGIPMLVIIPLLVQAAKAAGLSDALAPWATLVLSLIAAVASELLVLFPDVNGPVYIVIYTIFSSLLMYLACTGLYHTGKNIGIAVGLVQPNVV